MQDVYKQVCQAHPEYRHGKDGYLHGKGCFAYSPEIIGQQEGNRPDDHGQAMSQDESFRKGSGHRGQVITADPKASANNQYGADHGQKRVIQI